MLFAWFKHDSTAQTSGSLPFVRGCHSGERSCLGTRGVSRPASTSAASSANLGALVSIQTLWTRVPRSGGGAAPAATATNDPP